MRISAYTIVLALACYVWSITVFAQATLEIQECIDRIASRTHSANELIIDAKEECPKINAILSEIDTSQLDPIPQQDISFSQLLDIKHALSGEHFQTRPGPVLLLDKLDSVLEQTLQPRSQSADDKSWWKIFVEWLSEKFKSEKNAENYQPFIDWLKSLQLPDWLGPTIFYSSLAILAIVLLIIVYTEIRAVSLVSLFSRTKNKKQFAQSNHIHRNQRTLLSIDEIANLPPGDLVVALLNRLRVTLHENGIIKDVASVTNSEYLSLVEQNLPDKSPIFVQLILWANVSLFGNKPISKDISDELYGLVSTIEYPVNR